MPTLINSPAHEPYSHSDELEPTLFSIISLSNNPSGKVGGLSLFTGKRINPFETSQ
uniref:Uncharacterized protein n=1 Tax=Rhizophora mucronata TaxID=61149 RepID=A0A2P2PUN2_RHIMU